MADSKILSEQDKKEIARYLGYGKVKPDPETESLIDIVAEEAISAVEFRRIYISAPVLDCADDASELNAADEPDALGKLEILGKRISSTGLARNLTGCDRCYIIAASLGAECDRLMARYASASMAKAVVLQAVCTQLLETRLNELERELADLPENSGKIFRPRFSPGYGDLDIALQGWILKVLEAPKKIGLSLTQSKMLTPSKSVTAFLGVARADGCPKKGTVFESGCSSCDKKDCAMRQEN